MQKNKKELQKVNNDNNRVSQTRVGPLTDCRIVSSLLFYGILKQKLRSLKYKTKSSNGNSAGNSALGTANFGGL